MSYELARYADLKLQFEHVYKPARAIGVFTQISPGLVNSAQYADIVSLAFDVVF